ncbi:MAG: hypothetical protein AB8G86_26030 [Saprospiraceae bacterium]
MNDKKDYLDLADPLIVDTYLSVKIGSKFVHYAIPRERKDGTLRMYGDLYKYFTQEKKDFRFAIGYLLSDDEVNWYGQNQYMYFDRSDAPFLSFKETKKFILPKRK